MHSFLYVCVEKAGHNLAVASIDDEPSFLVWVLFHCIEDVPQAVRKRNTLKCWCNHCFTTIYLAVTHWSEMSNPYPRDLLLSVPIVPHFFYWPNSSYHATLLFTVIFFNIGIWLIWMGQVEDVLDVYLLNEDVPNSLREFPARYMQKIKFCAFSAKIEWWGGSRILWFKMSWIVSLCKYLH